LRYGHITADMNGREKDAEPVIYFGLIRVHDGTNIHRNESCSVPRTKRVILHL